MSWAKRRHPKQGVKEIVEKYWHKEKLEKWNFCTLENGEPDFELLKHSEIHHKEHTKVKGNASPYDGDLIYWNTRKGKHPLLPDKYAKLLKKQDGKCNHCGLFFKDGDKFEIDHIIPKSKGGKNNEENKQLLHRHCHDKKTASDGSLGNKSDCNSVKPKSQSNALKYKWVDDMLVTQCT